ncbi:MAG: hypothetical protein U1D67_05440, partial [Dehalococcoidia bacterium]|nr:hypothetical protein [Dehalococcoidia bacterium]
MKKLTLALVSVALAVLLGLTACTPFRGPGSSGGGGGMMGSQGGGGMMGPSVQGQQPRQGQPYPYGSGGGMGTGMMGPGGMMGSGMMGGMPMMGGTMGYYPGVPTALSHDNAEAIADKYLASLNNTELVIDEFEEYSHNFYLSLSEKSSGRGGIEIIIDRYSGSYQSEPQSMTWNGKYGMMVPGMTGSNQQAQMPVIQQQAMKIAQEFLDVVYPGTEA